MFRVERVAETGSTNDDAARLLGDPASGGLVLCADHQRDGYGRRGRAWHAEPGTALLFTAILPRKVASDALWAATFWTALAVADGIEAATGVHVALQWPNDLLMDGRKCCGILCASRIAGDDAWVASGVGINVVRPAHSAALATIVPPPAFLADVAKTCTANSRDAILYAILAAFETSLAALDDPYAIARAWERRAALAGTHYRILEDGADEPLDTTALRIGHVGSLVIDDNGTERAISLADARVVRDT